MKNRKTETRWVIAFKQQRTSGLYTGQYLTRKDAIRDHCDAIGFRDSPYDEARRVPTTPQEYTLAWEQCRQRGDYATKAKISWEV